MEMSGLCQQNPFNMVNYLSFMLGDQADHIYYPPHVGIDQELGRAIVSGRSFLELLEQVRAHSSSLPLRVKWFSPAPFPYSFLPILTQPEGWSEVLRWSQWMIALSGLGGYLPCSLAVM